MKNDAWDGLDHPFHRDRQQDVRMLMRDGAGWPFDLVKTFRRFSDRRPVY